MTQVLALANAIDQFITGCKADGTWGAVKSSCILAGWNNLDGALTPLAGTAPTNFNFWGSADPSWANVSLLLRMNGANASTAFTDSSSNALTVTTVGNAQISTAQSKFGGSSGLFDGSGDYLQLATNTAFSFSADFTVEFWVRQSSAPTENFPIILERGTGSEVSGSWGIIVNNSGANKACSFFYGGPRSYVSIGNLTFDTWHFVAVSRSGSTLRTFIDGVQTSSATVTADLTTTNTLRVGSSGFGVASNFFKGNVDDLRITKGVARYTANFTPPTQTFPGSTADYNRETGLVGTTSGSKYLASNRANNADPQNSNHNAVYITIAIPIVGVSYAEYMVSADASGTGANALLAFESNLYFRSRNSSATLAGSVTPSGLLGSSRSSSASFIRRANGANTTVSDTSQTPNSSIINTGRYSAASFAFYSIGESLDLALLDNRVTALVNAITAAIP